MFVGGLRVLSGFGVSVGFGISVLGIWVSGGCVVAGIAVEVFTGCVGGATVEVFAGCVVATLVEVLTGELVVTAVGRFVVGVSDELD